jgi:neutral ceramidase
MFEIGTGIGDITAFKKGIGMMGYGMHFNTVEEIETPLFARAFVIKDPSTQKKVVFVNAEICFITISIKSGVIKKLNEKHPDFGYTHDNVILTAQHTHSAPGGYSHYAFYNLSIPGFVPEVYETIVNGILEAIVKAENSIQPANLYLNTGTFEPELEVAFNRSIRAYNANPEVQKIDADKTHLAVDREMTLIRIEGLNGEKIGMINWFGVHTTSISNDNTKICADNKGYASAYFEEDIRSGNEQKNFIAAFAQGATGDISPNFIWDTNKKWMRGKFEDDFESAKFNGRLQYTKAKEIYDTALKNQPLKNDIDYVNMSFDFSNVVPDTEFTKGQKEQTGPACHGVAFFVGTAEARGMNDTLAAIARFCSRTVKIYELIKAKFLTEEKGNIIRNKYKIQGKKDILFETGEGRVLGTSNISNLIIPSWVDKGIKTFKTQYRDGALKAPWIPQILPLQIIIIGELAIASFPGEITTIAGLRLKNTIQGILEKKGIKKVIISPYANAFCGYVTTYEEYQCQLYEGGHTVFGEWTLAAFQTKFKELALQLLKEPKDRIIDKSVVPLEFTKEELSKRSYLEV